MTASTLERSSANHHGPPASLAHGEPVLVAPPLSGEGAVKHWGRYSGPGVPALYIPEAFATAVAEYEQDLGFQRGTLCAYDVEAEQILDLTDPATLRTAGLESGDLAGPWK